MFIANTNKDTCSKFVVARYISISVIQERLSATTYTETNVDLFMFSQDGLSKIGRTLADLSSTPLRECITFVRGTVNVSSPRVLSARLRLVVPSSYQFLVPRASEIL